MVKLPCRPLVWEVWRQVCNLRLLREAMHSGQDLRRVQLRQLSGLAKLNSNNFQLNYFPLQGRCVICGGPGISDAYYCKECTVQEKDRDGCPKIVNLGSSKTDLFYEMKKYGFKKRWNQVTRLVPVMWICGISSICNQFYNCNFFQRCAIDDGHLILNVSSALLKCDYLRAVFKSAWLCWLWPEGQSSHTLKSVNFQIKVRTR